MFVFSHCTSSSSSNVAVEYILLTGVASFKCSKIKCHTRESTRSARERGDKKYETSYNGACLVGGMNNGHEDKQRERCSAQEERERERNSVNLCTVCSVSSSSSSASSYFSCALVLYLGCNCETPMRGLMKMKRRSTFTTEWTKCK